jgi:hypothetical protein
MAEQFETRLMSAEELIDGIMTRKSPDGGVWEFKSIDGTVELVIGRDEHGKWERIGGTEPYLSSWVDELARHIK